MNLRISRVLALSFAARGPALACAHQGGAGYLQQHDDSHIALDIDAEGSVQLAAGNGRVNAPPRRLTVTSMPLNSFGHGSDVATDVLLKVSDAAQGRPTQIRRVSSDLTSGSAPTADRPARRLSVETMPLNSFGHSGNSDHLIESGASSSVHEDATAEVGPAGIVQGSESPAGDSTAKMVTRPRSLIIQTVPLNSFGHSGGHDTKNETPQHYARTARDEARGRSRSMIAAGLFALGLTTLGCGGAYYARNAHRKAKDYAREADPTGQQITIT